MFSVLFHQYSQSKHGVPSQHETKLLLTNDDLTSNPNFPISTIVTCASAFSSSLFISIAPVHNNHLKTVYKTFKHIIKWHLFKIVWLNKPADCVESSLCHNLPSQAAHWQWKGKIIFCTRWNHQQNQTQEAQPSALTEWDREDSKGTQTSTEWLV